MAAHDLPTMIQFVLNETKQTELSYIGHSQGTLIMFALLSQDPAFASKVSVCASVVILCP